MDKSHTQSLLQKDQLRMKKLVLGTGGLAECNIEFYRGREKEKLQETNFVHTLHVV